MEKEKSTKIYSVRIDNENKGYYSENIRTFTLMANSIDEVLEKAKSKLKKSDIKDGDCVGNIELICYVPLF